MLEVIAASSVPLRPAGLALLLKEQTKRNTLQIYAGNIQWSILQALHSMAKSELKTPTYSDVWDMITAEESKESSQKKEVEEVRQAVWDMLNRFS